jgi:8-oxo-dGTP pyrophosphatase MutT (NUDIX family)
MKNPWVYKEKVGNIALINPEGKILMELRKWGEYWSFFGWLIKKWEKPKNGAIREVKEETWFKVKNLLLLGENTLEYTWRHGKTQKTRFLYISPLTVPKEELAFKWCEWGEFFELDEIPSLTLKKPLNIELQMIQDFFEEIKNFHPPFWNIIQDKRQEFLALMQNHLR